MKKNAQGQLMPHLATFVPWSTAGYLALQGVRRPFKVARAAGKVIRATVEGQSSQKDIDRRLLGYRRDRSGGAGPEGPKRPRGRPVGSGKYRVVVGSEYTSAEGRPFV